MILRSCTSHCFGESACCVCSPSQQLEAEVWFFLLIGLLCVSHVLLLDVGLVRHYSQHRKLLHLEWKDLGCRYSTDQGPKVVLKVRGRREQQQQEQGSSRSSSVSSNREESEEWQQQRDRRFLEHWQQLITQRAGQTGGAGAWSSTCNASITLNPPSAICLKKGGGGGAWGAL